MKKCTKGKKKNELGDGFVQLGYLVIRMYMIGGCGNEEIIDYEEGVLDLVSYIKEQFHMENETIVIGHRENSIQAVKLMIREKWKVGILLYCELDRKYGGEEKIVSTI